MAERDDSLAIVQQEFNFSSFSNLLVPETNVLAIHLLNDSDASSDLLSVPNLTAALMDGDFSHPVFFDTPTPQSANSEGKVGFVAEVEFSVERGLKDAPFVLSILNSTPDADIYVTTNGDAPAPETPDLESTNTVRSSASSPSRRNGTRGSSTDVG